MKVTVITINYNHAEGLCKTIESVQRQTLTDFEYIIVDGNSSDGSREIIEAKEHEIRQKQISFKYISESDNGIYEAMNKGVRMSDGDYCIFINSGDELYRDDVLANMQTYLGKEDIVCGNLCYGKSNICPNPDTVTMRTFYKHTLYHQASFIRTRLLKEHPYDENMRSAADWKFFMHELIFRSATYKHVPVVVARFETGGVSSTNREVSQKEVADELRKCFPKRVLEDYEDYVFGCTPYRQMFTTVEQIPPVKRIIYKVNVCILKVMNLWLKSDWIRNLK
ncbi:MAG: glycosyltransferase [Prevotella sp.]|nr:glycosyltransferase [Prevotella sp.]